MIEIEIVSANDIALLKLEYPLTFTADVSAICLPRPDAKVGHTYTHTLICTNTHSHTQTYTYTFIHTHTNTH